MPTYNERKSDALEKLRHGRLKFENLDEKLRNDKDIALAAVQHSGYNLETVLENLGEELKKDTKAIKDIVVKAVKQIGYYIFDLIPEHLKKDRQIVNLMKEATNIQEEQRIISS